MAIQCKNLVEQLILHAENQPDKILYTYLADGETETASLTFAQLDQAARCVARQLLELASPESRVLMLFDSGMDFITSFFGCLYAGMIAVPAYPPRFNRNIARVTAIIQDCQPAIIITNRAVTEKMAEWRDNSPTFENLAWLDVESIDTQGVVQAPAQEATQARVQLPEWQPASISPDSIAFLQYTSGSTGSPKGVQVTHANIMHNEALIQHAFGIDAHAIGVSWLPLFHDLGLIGMILAAACAGARCIFMPPEQFVADPKKWLKAISRYRATASAGPSFAYELCSAKIRLDDIKDLDLSSWRVLINGAEAVNAEVMRRFTSKFAPLGFREETFLPAYGMAETTLFVCGEQASEKPVTHLFDGASLTHNQAKLADAHADTSTSACIELVSCGKSNPSLPFQIVDPDSFDPCAANCVGEIWVEGGSVAAGYWNKPELSKEIFAAFTKDNKGPFLRTGDLGFVNELGELYITGRCKELIIIRGQNHYPQDIEQTVQRDQICFKSGAGIAFSINSENDKEKLVIVQEVERQFRKNIDAHSLFQNVAKALMIHHGLELETLVLVAPTAIPKTSSGKLQRNLCKQRFLTNGLEPLFFVSAQNNQEAAIKSMIDGMDNHPVMQWAHQWLCKELKLEPIQLRMSLPFYEYRWDFSKDRKFCNAIYQRFMIRIDPVTIWNHPSIGDFCDWLESKISSNLQSAKSSFQLANEVANAVANTDEAVKTQAQQWADSIEELGQGLTRAQFAAFISGAMIGLLLGKLPTMSHIDQDQSLMFEVGIDSSTSAWFKLHVFALIKETANATLLYDYPTMNALSNMITTRYFESRTDDSSNNEIDSGRHSELDSIENLSLEEQMKLIELLSN